MPRQSLVISFATFMYEDGAPGPVTALLAYMSSATVLSVDPWRLLFLVLALPTLQRQVLRHSGALLSRLTFLKAEVDFISPAWGIARPWGRRR